MLRKSLAALLVLVLLSALAVAPAFAEPAEGEKVTMNVMFQGGATGADRPDFVMQKLTERFPDIEFIPNIVMGDESNYATKIRTLIAAGGEGLDVWWDRGGTWVMPVLAAKAALPLNEYLDKVPVFWDTVTKSAIKPHTDGNIYAIPCEEVFWEIIHYNKAIFDQYNLEVPKTLDELIEVCRVLKENGVIPIVCSALAGWPACMMVEGFAYTIDPEITKKIMNGEAKFSDEPYVEAAKAIKKLLDAGAFYENTPLCDEAEAQALFYSGKAAMWPNGSWALAPAYENMDGNCDYFYYPAIRPEDVDEIGKTCSGGVKDNAGAMVYSGTKYPQLATEVAVAMSQSYQQYLCEHDKSPFVVYDGEALGWDIPDFAPPSLRLVEDMGKFEFSYPFVQDVMPSAAAATMLMDSTNKFFTNSSSYGVDEFIADLDRSMLEK